MMLLFAFLELTVLLAAAALVYVAWLAFVTVISLLLAFENVLGVTLL